MNGDFTIAGHAWLRAVHAVGQAAKDAREAGEAMLDLGENELRLTYSGKTAIVPAEGSGQGRAIFSGAYVQVLANLARLAGAQTLRLCVDQDGALLIGGTRVSCRWALKEAARIELRPGHGLSDVLQLRYQHSQAALVDAGLAGQVFEAECRKAELVARAAEVLALLGISLPELDHFVTASIKDRARTNSERRARRDGKDGA